MSASGLVSGTPTSTGNYAFMLHAQDSAGHTFTRNETLAVFNTFGLQVTNVNVLNFNAGFGLTGLLSTNGGSTYSWSVAPLSPALPPGLTLRSDAAVTALFGPNTTIVDGSITTPGTYSVTLRATDNANAANFADHTFTRVAVPHQIVSPAYTGVPLPAAPVNTVYSFTFQVAGGTPPYAFVESPFLPLPAGLSLSSTGTLSGTPSQTGAFNIRPLNTDASGALLNGYAFVLAVIPAGGHDPLRNVGVLQHDASVGSPYEFVLDQALRSGTRPFTWSVASGTLPPGIVLFPGGNGVSAYLGGTPTTPGPYSFTLTATDAAAETVMVPISLNVSVLSLNQDSLPPAMVGTPYSQTVLVTGGTAPYTFRLSPGSDMPSGLTLSSAGVFSGTPNFAGRQFSLCTVTDSAANTLTTL